MRQHGRLKYHLAEEKAEEKGWPKKRGRAEEKGSGVFSLDHWQQPS